MGCVLHGLIDSPWPSTAKTREFTQYLISMGADIEHRGYRDMTPLLHAARNLEVGNLKCSKELVSAGCNISATDCQGRGVLHIMLLRTRDMTLNVFRAWKYGKIASEEFLEECLVLLMNKGCDPNTVDKDGRSPSDYIIHEKEQRLWIAALQKAGHHDTADAVKNIEFENGWRKHRLV